MKGPAANDNRVSGKADRYIWPIIFSILLTAGMLLIVQFKVPKPMLLLDRFFPGTGWLEIVVLSLYAGWLTPKILNPLTSVRWRAILWLTFSIIFFSQLTLGLLGMEKFLMSGKLHLPIPALIIGGPLYRGEGFFMPIMLLATLLVIGPAWCSYFCYIGSWDFIASRRKKRSTPMPVWRQPVRLVILALVTMAAYLLGKSDLPVSYVIWIAAFFGLGGIAVMSLVSPKKGVMTHCTTYCPIGAVANVLGKVSPFRLKINDSCVSCQKCSKICRYDALKLDDIERKKPGSSCTLCGDCISSCKKDSIIYTFAGLSPRLARTLFVVLVVSFHAVSIGIARI